MKKKSITTNYVYNLIYELIIFIVPLCTTPYLARTLSSNELGTYSYTLSIVTIFFLISALGINTYGQREIAYVEDDKKKRSKIFFELLIIRIVSTLLSLALLLIFVLVTNKYKMYYLIFSIYVFGNIFDISWFYQGIEDFKGVSIRNLIVKIIYVISILLFIKKESDIYLYVLLYSLSTVITNLSFWININKYIGKVNINELEFKKHIKNVLYLFIPQIASLIYTVLDKTMIGLIVPDINNVYYYEQASFIDKKILILITTIGTVMMSRVSNAFIRHDTDLIKQYLKEIINFVWLFGSALAFGICAVIKGIVPWFYGPNYTAITSLVYYMAPIIVVIGLNNVIGIQYLIPTKKQNKYILSICIGCFFNVCLNSILIPLIGAKGAVISSVLAELLILLIELHYVKDVITLRDIISPSFKYILFGLIMFIVVFYLSNRIGISIINTFIEAIVGIIIYVLLLLISKDSFFYKYVISYIKKIIKR